MECEGQIWLIITVLPQKLSDMQKNISVVKVLLAQFEPSHVNY